ncbi:MAG: nidogen-like domain-containing protein, partial [Planctomycetota bacterium]
LPEGDGVTYYVAVTSVLATANAIGINQPLTRMEPINSVNRIVEEHFDDASPDPSASVPSSLRLGITPDQFHLGDVVTYVNSGRDLYTIDPFTGVLETTVTDTGDLPGAPTRQYHDISMRNDGWLYTLQGRSGGGNQHAAIGNYSRINTGDARSFLTTWDEGITAYEVDPNNPTAVRVYNPGVEFHAMTQTDTQYVFAVGNIATRSNFTGTYFPGNGMDYYQNMLYVFDGNGNAIPFPNQSTGPRLHSDIVPRGQLISDLTLFAVPATDPTSPYADVVPPFFPSPGIPDDDIYDGLWFSITDNGLPTGTTLVFEFDSGPDVHMDRTGANAVRDGDRFMLNDGLATIVYELDSGPVVLVNNGTQINDGDTITIEGVDANNAQVTTVYEFNNAGGIAPTSDVAIPFQVGWTTGQVVTSVVNTINTAPAAQDNGITVVASGFVDPGTGLGRVSLVNDSLNVNGVVIGINGPRGPGVGLEGWYGVNPPANPFDPLPQNIPYEETWTATQLGGQIEAIVELGLNIDVSYAPPLIGRFTLTPPAPFGDRLTFGGATDAAFSPKGALANVFFAGANNDLVFTANTPGLAFNDVDIFFTGGAAAGAESATYVPPTAATVSIDPAGDNNAITLTANVPGAAQNGINVVFVETGFVTGDQAFVTYNPTTRTLTIDVDTTATTATTVVAEIDAQGAFDAELDLTGDPVGNDGSGLMADLTATGTLAGGTDGRLMVDINPATTTANIAIAVIAAEGTFTAALDTTADVGNDGSGLVLALGYVATTSGGSAVPASSLYHVPGSASGLTDLTRIPIDFKAEDDGDTIAQAIATAVTQAPFNAIATFFPSANPLEHRVSLQNVTAIDVSNSYPLTIQGGPAGGDITGIAYLGSQMYAVTERGGLYKVHDELNWGFRPVDPQSGFKYIMPRLGFGPYMEFVTTVTDDNGQPIPFSGLAAGPANVEDGKYANLLFATDNTVSDFDFSTAPRSSRLYAFDGSGNLQPLFLDAATYVDLPTSDARGVDFSVIDYNLWHRTNYRRGDAGHGVPQTWDFTRTPPDDYPLAGQTSWYFGLEDPRTSPGAIDPQPGAGNFIDYNNRDINNVLIDVNDGAFYTYDMPGGAYGILTTDTFSLKGYDRQDKPTVYVTYFADTENSLDYDGARAFISNDGANWTLLATNTDTNATVISSRLAVAGQRDRYMREVFDTGEWRQIRVDISQWTGLDNLRVRFDFSTASDMDVGVQNTTGEYLVSLPGKDLIDGQTFSIDSQVFEFDMGYALVMPLTSAGQRVDDREWFEVRDSNNVVIRFEFVRPGQTPSGGRLAINITDNMSSNEVALQVENAINGSGLQVTAFKDPDETDPRVFLIGATNVTPGGLVNVIVQGDAPGVVTSGVSVPTDGNMTDDQVASIVSDVVNQTLTGSTDQTVVKWDDDLGHLMHVIGHSVNGGPLPFANFLDGDTTGKTYPRTGNRFNNFQRGQDNAHEGLYVDDIIIGFAERGEMVTQASGDTSFSTAAAPGPGGAPVVTVGPYQLEIRRGEEYGVLFTYPDGTMVMDLGRPAITPGTTAFELFNTNDRLAQGFTLQAIAGADLHHGDTFWIEDGLMRQQFVFLDAIVGGGGGDAEPIYYWGGDSAADVGGRIASAVNLATTLNVTASSIATSERVDLFGATDVGGIIDFISFGAIESTGATSYVAFDPTGNGVIGDKNLRREKGQIVIQGNQVTHSAQYGIAVGPDGRDTSAQWPHAGSGRTINTPNDLVPGIMLENNLVAYGGQGGIRVSGETGRPTGAVPFVRVVNNTVYGGQNAPGGTGILVVDNASPTILNNIVANLDVGISVDIPSRGQGTVIGMTIYKDNAQNANAGTGLGSFARVLQPNDPLFVDGPGGNFYLREGSQAIDSSMNSMEERQTFFDNVLEPAGIPVSPINAPERDLYGQLRVDDPKVAPPPGMGSNVFKDRGAIDRVDFLGPFSELVVPEDNDAVGLDRNPTFHRVVLVGETVFEFAVQLLDTGGVGINDATVTTQAVTVLRDDVPLVDQFDYFFQYDATNDVIHLVPAAGVWQNGHVYTIVLDNQAILDMAGNPLQANQPDGSTQFTVSLSGIDYGDAPDPPYPSLKGSNGAQHVIFTDYHLGMGVTGESESRQNGDASGDPLDDGVVFDGDLVMEQAINVTVTAPLTGIQPGWQTGDPVGYLDAWVDLNGDGVWADFEFPVGSGQIVSEKIFDAEPLFAGDNVLQVATPRDGVVEGDTFARFRFSSVGGLDVTGEAVGGEVEDYQVKIVPYIRDFGDAPAQIDTTGDGTANKDTAYPTLLADNGAWHALGGDNVYLGFAPPMPDAEDDGQPDPDALGDDNARSDDENGVVIPFMTPGEVPDVFVFVETAGWLNAWIDYNVDGDWDDPGEKIADGLELKPDEPIPGSPIPTVFNLRELQESANPPAGLNLQPAPGDILPAGVSLLTTYARFRFNVDPGDPTIVQHVDAGGMALNGEVEDHSVLVIAAPEDFGDAPAPFPVLTTEDGARHRIVGGFQLGDGVDNEFEGVHSANADADDNTDLDDEDGVRFGDLDPNSPMAGTLRANAGSYIYVYASQDGGFLNAWIDLNDDDSWDGYTDVDGNFVSEHVFQDVPLDGGVWNRLTLKPDVPVALGSIDAVARLRFSHEQGLSYTTPVGDLAPDGEVEDYLVSIVEGDAKISGWKFNDRNADGAWNIQGSTTPIPNIALQPLGSGTLVTMSGVDSDGQTYTNVGPNDDLSSDLQPFGFNFEFFGNTYTDYYINNNGNITFVNPLPAFSPQGFPQTTPIVAPFWADVDTRSGGGEVYLSTGTNPNSGNPFVQVDWVDVGYFDHTGAINTDARNAFSLYIEEDPVGDVVIFDYTEMNWTTGDTTGIGGLGGLGAQIGFDSGDGTNFFSLMRPTSLDDLSDLLQIERYAIRIDPASGLPVEAEPGIGNVMVFLDLNRDGKLGDDPFGFPEPVTWTLEDDPVTINVNEEGYYEFTGLFAGNYDVYEVLEAPLYPTDQWVQTGPDTVAHGLDDLHELRAVDGTQIVDGQTFSIGGVTFEFDSFLDGNYDAAHERVVFNPPDSPNAGDPGDTADQIASAVAAAIQGAAGLNVNAQATGDVITLTVPAGGTIEFNLLDSPLRSLGSHRVLLAAGGDEQDVDFGNFRLPHLTVSDIEAAEGDVGPTTVDVTVHLTQSFGANVAVDYATADDTTGTDPATADSPLPGLQNPFTGDYEPESSPPTTDFGPQPKPLGVWTSQAVGVLPSSRALVGAGAVQVGLNLTLVELGSPFGSGFIPPDTMGAVGLDHIVAFVNGRYSVFDKFSGALLQTDDLNQFWLNAGASVGGQFDPRIVYDPTVDRWFASSIDAPAGANSIFIAVSVDGDPTNGWRSVEFVGDTIDGVRFNDYDTMAVDADGLYIATNNYGGPSGFDVSIYSIPKADLLAATPSLANMTRFEAESDAIRGSSIQAALDFGPSDGQTALFGTIFPGGNAIKRSDIVGAGGPGATISATSVDVFVPPYTVAPDARQPNGVTIESVSPRFTGNVVKLGDSVWAVHAVSGSFGTNAAMRWYEIDEPSNTVVQTGLIEDATFDWLDPSIAVNAVGQVVIGATGSGPDPGEFASAYAMVGTTTSGVTTFGSPILLQAGRDNYFEDFGSGRNRWGDYSATIVDPADPSVFWTFQEFAAASDRWGVQVSSLLMPAVRASYDVSGDYVVWNSIDGDDSDIFLYDALSNTPSQLTDNDTEDYSARIHGSHVVWVGHDGNIGPTGAVDDSQIYLYDITAETTTQLTDHAYAVGGPQVSDTHVVWWADTAVDREVYLYDITAGTTDRISAKVYDHAGLDDFDPQLSGSLVGWYGFDGKDYEAYLYDAGNDRVVEVTQNALRDDSVRIDGTNVVWTRFDGNDDEIFLFEYDPAMGTGTTTQITNNDNSDNTPVVSGVNVAWQGYDGVTPGDRGDWDIFHYDVESGLTTNVSANAFMDDSSPAISGDRIVWDTERLGGDWEVMHYVLGTDDAPQKVSDLYPDEDRNPLIDDNLVVWRSFDGQDARVMIARQAEPEITETVSLTVWGDTRLEEDETFLLNLIGASVAGLDVPVDTVVIDDSEAVITILNDDSGIDFGDAPATYPNLLQQNGARHEIKDDLFLGDVAKPDPELDGKPSIDALGDDNDLVGDDEDGVVPLTRLVPGEDATFEVKVTGDGYLAGWIDLNGDGMWADFAAADGTVISERVISPTTLYSTGTHFVEVKIPDDLTAKTTFARFRLSSDPNAISTPRGQAPDGEVEDYQVEIEVGQSSISGWKFDDVNGDGSRGGDPTGNVPPINLLPLGSGFQVMAPNDDGSSQAINFGFGVQFYGNTFTQFYVNNNGNITFDGPLGQFTPSGFPTAEKVIAPFWADVDTRGSGTVTVGYGVSPRNNAFVQIDWVDVGYFSMHVDKLNTFTLYIENDPAGDFVVFVYDKLEWTTGDASGGVGGFGGQGAQIGFDAGDFANFVSVARPATAADLAAIPAQVGFQLSPLTGLPAGVEPGLAGVTVYLDLNDNGKLDVGDPDGDGVIEPIEPWTVTMEDDPTTPSFNETGFYQFDDLFDDDYVVREIRPDDSIQTFPRAGETLFLDTGSMDVLLTNPAAIGDGQTFTLGDGVNDLVFEFDDEVPANFAGDVRVNVVGVTTSDLIAAAIANAVNGSGLGITATVAGDVVTLDGQAIYFTSPVGTPLTAGGNSSSSRPDGSYLIRLDPQEDLTEVNFGNFKRPHIEVLDVAVAEGNGGFVAP